MGQEQKSRARTMKVQKTILPGNAGSKRFYDEYGDKLVCVRYRNDEQRKRKLTTIELIVEERSHLPVIVNQENKFAMNELVGIKIDFKEIQLRQLVKQHGGVWNKVAKYWELSYGQARELKLLDRVINSSLDDVYI